MFEHSSVPGSSFAPRHIAAYAAVVVLGGALGGYALHEHNTARDLTAKNQQATAALDQTKQQLSDLSSKVNTLVARAETQPAPAAVAAPRSAHPSAAHPVRREDPRYKKLQAQLDAQNKALEETRSQIASTQGDLANTRTELT